MPAPRDVYRYFYRTEEGKPYRIWMRAQAEGDEEVYLDENALASMKPSAFLINTARGALVNEPHLVAALEKKIIAGAGLDVTDPEPPLEGSPLYHMDNVVLTPHIGWKRLETRQRLMDAVAANVEAYLAGKPVNVVS